MYEDVGKKIQVLAKICGWTVLVLGVIGFFVVLTNEYVSNLLAWGSLFAGLMGLVSTWLLYGFGQLIDDIHDMRIKNKLQIQNSPLPVMGKANNNTTGA